MSLISELNSAFNECFSGINTQLILDNLVEKDVFIIQLEVSVENIGKILKENQFKLFDKELIKYKEYLALCELCLFIDKTTQSVENALFKEDYLSEEVYRYLIVQLEYIGKKIDYLFRYEDCSLIGKYLEHVSLKYYNYIRIIKDKLGNSKIK